jgi:cyclophilin family peptidyl-prolyl cis-trans isomerase
MELSEEKFIMVLSSKRCITTLLVSLLATVTLLNSSAEAANTGTTVLKFVVNTGPVDPNDPNDPNVHTIHVRMLYDDAHATVGNFMNYVNDGDYNNSIFHRLHVQPGLEVLQGGGIAYNNGYYYLDSDAPIADDYDRPNLRGTISMAKTSAANSATNGFFFNLDDANAVTLDPQHQANGGFMVFAYVIGDDMDTLDDLAGYAPNPLGVEINPLGYAGNMAVLAEIPLVPDGDSLYFEWIESVSVVGMDGDADFDGDVDGDDYAVLLGEFGESKIGLYADFDGDYDVDLADFAILRANFGDTASAPLPTPGASAPEPASMCMLGLGALAILRKRRRKV